MAEFTIQLANDKSSEAIKEVARRRLASLELCGQQAERNAKLNLERSPRRIDTGNLRNSITHALGGEPPAISSYQGDNPSRYDGKERSGSYSGNAPEAADTVFVGTNVEYALHVHEGTERMAPNYYLRDAIGQHIEEYKAIIEKVLRGG